MISPIEVSPTTVALISGAIVTILGAIFAGIISVITAVRNTKTVVASIENNTTTTQAVVVASAEASKTRGAVRDNKLRDIHILVNSKFTTVLRMLVTLTKKEAARTKLPEDINAYQEALSLLSESEAAAGIVKSIDATARLIQEDKAAIADQKLTYLIDLTSKEKKVDDLNKQLLNINKKES